LAAFVGNRQMVEMLYLASLLMAVVLIVIQDSIIKRKEKLLALQHDILLKCEPVIVAMIELQEKALKNK
jgi:hypothetical protein